MRGGNISPFGYTASVYTLTPENDGYKKLWTESSQKMNTKLEAENWAKDFVYSHAKAYSLQNPFPTSLYFREHTNDDGLDIFVVCGTDYTMMITIYERTEEILSQKDVGFFTKDTI